jgi:NTP pyrophosphatase (non-canonical NTP hydrolase)
MNNEIIQKHREMVLRLAKPGESILKSLTPWDCDFSHMGGCLPGEASELFDAIREYLEPESDPGRQDLIEELGDYAFYLHKCSNFFNRKWHGNKSNLNHPQANCVQLMRLGGHYWDPVKRIVIYRKSRVDPDKKYEGKSLDAVCVELLDEMEGHFNAILQYFDLTLEEVLEANYKKLADADTGRFSTGSYSDQQAQDRKDKAVPAIGYDESVNQHITARKKL